MLTFKEILEQAQAGHDITPFISQEIVLTLSPGEKLEINAWAYIHGTVPIDFAPTQDLKYLGPSPKRRKTFSQTEAVGPESFLEDDELQNRPAKRARIEQPTENQRVTPYQECYQWLIEKSSAELITSTFVEFQQKTADEKAIIACIAAQLDRNEFIEQLLDRRLISLRTHYPQAPWATMLYFAAASANKDLVLALMKELTKEKPSDLISVDLASPKGYTIFHMAAGTNNLSLLQEMVRHYETMFPNSPFIKFNKINIRMQKLTQVRKATQVLEWITQEIEDAKTKKQESPLQFAARIGDEETLQNILANPGASVNINILNYALLLAAQNGHADSVRKLLAQGAEVNSKNNKGWTALMLAAKRGHLPVVEALLAVKGIDVTAAENNNQDTALSLILGNRDLDQYSVLCLIHAIVQHTPGALDHRSVMSLFSPPPENIVNITCFTYVTCLYMLKLVCTNMIDNPTFQAPPLQEILKNMSLYLGNSTSNDTITKRISLFIKQIIFSKIRKCEQEFENLSNVIKKIVAEIRNHNSDFSRKLADDLEAYVHGLHSLCVFVKGNLVCYLRRSRLDATNALPPHIKEELNHQLPEGSKIEISSAATGDAALPDLAPKNRTHC